MLVEVHLEVRVLAGTVFRNSLHEFLNVSILSEVSICRNRVIPHPELQFPRLTLVAQSKTSQLLYCRKVVGDDVNDKAFPQGLQVLNIWIHSETELASLGVDGVLPLRGDARDEERQGVDLRIIAVNLKNLALDVPLWVDDAEEVGWIAVRHVEPDFPKTE